MTTILVWSVATFGFSWVIADAKVSYGVRMLMGRTPRLRGWPLSLVECVACTGFWVGLLGQILGIAPFASWWLAALYTCGSNLLLAKYVGLLDE